MLSAQAQGTADLGHSDIGPEGVQSQPNTGLFGFSATITVCIRLFAKFPQKLEGPSVCHHNAYSPISWL